MKQLSSLNTQPIAAMSGFTSDFFLTLETTFSDNTLNDSRMDRSQFNPNKSTFLRELKQESLDKIIQKMQKLVLGVIFEQVYWWGIKKKRVEDKTPINIYKNFYKINLMLKVKLSAKLSWAFHAINKFTIEFDMGKLKQIHIEKQQQKNQQTIPIELPRLREVETPLTQIIEQKKNAWEQNSMNALCQKLFKIISHKQIDISFKNIQKEEYEIQKKLYLLQLIAHIFNNQMRHNFVQIYISNLNSIRHKQQQILGKRQREVQEQIENRKTIELEQQTKQENKQNQSQKQNPPQKFIILSKQDTFVPIKPQREIPSFKSEPLIKFSKMQKQNDSNKIFYSDKNLNEQKRTNPPLGLKFSRCLKKTNQRNQSNFPNIKAPIISTNTIKFKCSLQKSCKVETALSEDSMFRKFVWEDFIYSQRTYHLAPQQIKMELPDIQDKNTIFENEQMFESKKSSSLNSKLTFSKRLHKLQSKSPLQFSNKRVKSKNSSTKSKKSVGKASESETENELNQLSLKSYYYFPEKQNYGKAEVSIPGKPQSPTKNIGSTRWTGQAKKRTTTQTSGRSTDKVNPYFQQLKERSSRKPTQPMSLHKMIERSLSGRSTSRRDRQRDIPRKTQIQQSQYSSHHKEKNEKQQKTSRNISPQPQQAHQQAHQQRSVEQLNFVGVPKQWHVYRNSPKNQIHTRVRESKPFMQFQKLESNAFKL